MYPEKELGWLALQKEVVRQKSALQRLRCENAAIELAAPLESVDRAVGYWRQFSPYLGVAKLPLALFAGRAVWKGRRWVPLAIRLTPLVWALSRRSNPQARLFLLSAARSFASNMRRWLERKRAGV